MELVNISKSKIIGIGGTSVFPGMTIKVPKGFETNPVLKTYKDAGMAIIVEDSVVENSDIVKDSVVENSDIADGSTGNSIVDKDDAEKIRKNRLASLKNISDEDLAKLAEELEVNPADCIDSADMLKKVRAALSKK